MPQVAGTHPAGGGIFRPAKWGVFIRPCQSGPAANPGLSIHAHLSYHIVSFARSIDAKFRDLEVMCDHVHLVLRVSLAACYRSKYWMPRGPRSSENSPPKRKDSGGQPVKVDRGEHPSAAWHLGTTRARSAVSSRLVTTPAQRKSSGSDWAFNC